MEDSFSKQCMRWRTAYEVEDSLGGEGLWTWQRSQILKWKQLLFAIHLYLLSLNCVSFENSIFICLISWCLVTLLSFSTSVLLITILKLTICCQHAKCCPPFSVKSDCISTYLMCLTSTISMLYWCSTGALASTCKVRYNMMTKCFSTRQLKLY